VRPAVRRTALVAHPGSELYGSDRVLLESVSALVENNWRVVVTVPADGPLLPLIRERGAEVIIAPAPVVRKSVLRPLGMLRFLRTAVKSAVVGSRLMARERPSMVFVNTTTIPLWLVMARLRRIPTIAHVHEGEASASRLIRAVLASPLFFATRIVVNSRFSEKVLTGSFPRLGRRSTVVYNGVPGPESPVAARPTLNSPLRAVYIGRLSPRKGVDVAISAMAELAERGITIHLDIVGAVFTGYEWYEEQLRAQVVDLRLDDLVTFHGFVPSVWQIVADGDVVLVPSRQDEPFGDTAVEAILAERFVIVSETSGLLEATAGYESVRRVRPGDPSDLSVELERLSEEWSDRVRALPMDAGTARSRHAPAVYMERIAAIAASLRSP
jgi:glycosyltransferase involved in cell wall biosynthesis